LKAWEAINLKRRGDQLAGMRWDGYTHWVARIPATMLNPLGSDVFDMGGGVHGAAWLWKD
jgi:hypothetical protein